MNRLAFSKAEGQGRDLVRDWLQELGLKVRVDSIGNMFAVRPDRHDGNGAPAVMTGSHLDTVASGGAYDGALGVLAGLEVLHVLQDNQIKTDRPVGVAVFTNEEGVVAQPDMMGSLVHCKALPLARALETDIGGGLTVAQGLERMGYAGDEEPGAQPIHSFIELHVEQGPILDAEKTPVGVVQAVQGLTWHKFTFHGKANHAGTAPMPTRNDPGCVACSLAAYLREICRGVDHELRATVGSMHFEPGMINVIPHTAHMTVDLRSLDPDAITRAQALMMDYVNIMAKPEKVRVEHTLLADVAPQEFNKQMVIKIEEAANALGLKHRPMTSGAGHDAQIIARIAPTAMIFVPSRHGVSHASEEFTKPEHLDAGANVLLQAILDAAGASI